MGGEMRRREVRHGSALVLVFAFLGLLAVLAVAFAHLMSVERDASATEVQRVQVAFACEAGVHYAVARLRATAREDLIPDPSRDWYYAPAADGTLPALAGCERPSFPLGETGYSGSLLLERGRRALFRIRVLDTSAQLDVGEGGAALDRRLESLAGILGLQSDVGSRVAAAGVVAMKEDLLRVLTREEYAALEPYVTVHGVTDPTAIRSAVDPVTGVERYEVHPRPWVCVNTAPVPVLAAVFEGTAASRGALVAGPIGRDQALALARAVVERRTERPFATRSDLERFLLGTGRQAAGLTDLQAAALAVATDPELRPAHLNDDLEHYRPFDVAHLAETPTALGLLASGIYEITSEADLFEGEEGPIARGAIDAVVRIARVDPFTTQAQFEAAIVGRSEVRSRPEPLFERAGLTPSEVDAVQFRLSWRCDDDGGLCRFELNEVELEFPWGNESVPLTPAAWTIVSEGGPTYDATWGPDGVWCEMGSPAEGQIGGNYEIRCDVPVNAVPLAVTFRLSDLEIVGDGFGSLPILKTFLLREGQMLGYYEVLLAQGSHAEVDGRPWGLPKNDYHYWEWYDLSGGEVEYGASTQDGHLYVEFREAEALARRHGDTFVVGDVEYRLDFDGILPPGLGEGGGERLEDLPPLRSPGPSGLDGSIGLGWSPMSTRLGSASFVAYQQGDLRAARTVHSDEAMSDRGARPGETAVDSVFAGGDCFVDGAFVDPDRFRVRTYRSAKEPALFSESNFPVEAGYVEFWFKPDESCGQDGEIVLFHGFNPDGENDGIQTALTWRDGELRLVRVFHDGVDSGAPGAPALLESSSCGLTVRSLDPLVDTAVYVGPRGDVDGAVEPPVAMPWTYREVRKDVDLVPHEWRHVEFWWSEFADCTLRVDGDDRPDEVLTSADGVFRSRIPVANDFGLGPRWADRGRSASLFPKGTFAGLRVVAAPSPEFLAGSSDDRYEANDDLDEPTAYADLDLSLGEEGEPVGLVWTEREASIAFVDVQLRSAGSRPTLEPRDGSGTLWPEEMAGLPVLPIRVVFSRDPLEPLVTTSLFERLDVLSLVETEFLSWRYRYFDVGGGTSAP